MSSLSPAMARAFASIDAGCGPAVARAIKSGADRLSDDDAFWRQVRIVFGVARGKALRERGVDAVIEVVDARIWRSRNAADLLALRTLRAATAKIAKREGAA